MVSSNAPNIINSPWACNTPVAAACNLPVAAADRIVISACDGMGTASHLLGLLNGDITRYIGVENSSVARTICNNLNPPEQSHFGGVDHSWHSDVFDITEESIANLGMNAIVLYVMQTPCEDFSLLRLLPPRYRNKKLEINPRPGLLGKKGAVTVQCLLVWTWIRKYNPACELFSENIKFDDMKADWDIVCKALGQPLVLDSADYSFSRRMRAYWTNFCLPDTIEAITAGFSPGDPNICMDPGRTVEPYLVDGKTTMRTIGASWSGNPDSPVADTNVPVIVHDAAFQKAQHINVNEVERILGLPEDATSGGGVSVKDRLRCLGKGWDVPTTLMLFRFSRLARNIPQHFDAASTRHVLSTTPSALDRIRSQMRTVRNAGGDSALVALLAASAPALQAQMLRILAEPAPSQVNYAGSVLDSGSSRHLSPHTCVTHSDDTLSLTGFNNSSAWTEGNGYLPLQMHDVHSDKPTSLDLFDADKFDGICPILSMGEMIRLGFSFYFEDAGNMYAIAPNGVSK